MIRLPVTATFPALRSFWTAVLGTVLTVSVVLAEDHPKIQFEKLIQDLGIANEGGSLSGKFYFTNTGTALLEVQPPETSCGCTVASVKPDKLKPGEQGEIYFTLDFTNIRGPAEKSITVPSNDPQHPLTQLILKAQVTPVFAFTPELLF